MFFFGCGYNRRDSRQSTKPLLNPALRIINYQDPLALNEAPLAGIVEPFDGKVDPFDGKVDPLEGYGIEPLDE